MSGPARWLQYQRLKKKSKQVGMDGIYKEWATWFGVSDEAWRLMYNPQVEEFIEHLCGCTAQAANDRPIVRRNITYLYSDWSKATTPLERLEAIIYIATYAAVFKNSYVHEPLDTLIDYLKKAL